MGSFEVRDVYWSFCVEDFVEVYAFEKWMLFDVMYGCFGEVIFAHSYSELRVKLEEFCDNVFGFVIEVLVLR